MHVRVRHLEALDDHPGPLAPEHLELCVDEPFRYLDKVKNAGSIFMGRSCPEAMGDYFAGPNHTLPTSGTARFSSPLSVDDFVKKSQFTYYTAEMGSLVSYEPEFEMKPMFETEINEFINCIKTGEKLASHIDTVAITARMMQAIYDSSAKHEEIKLD